MAKKVYEVPALSKASGPRGDTGFLKRGPHEPEVRLPLGW
ncbi:keywimysin-related RiPP [Streptomyces sp. TRM 70351]|nr:keywimysin-related RiPP [Streptomyces sp. TRM 70351]MEE1926762.1 keywimysin-related RiPP [Streptomyces sp. TRM 70351]